MADGDDSVILQPQKPTILLAALLLRPNAVVGVEELQRAVWGDERPATARSALHTCVLRVRQLFAKYGIAGTTVETVPRGYRIMASADTLDLIQFQQLLHLAATAGGLDAERGHLERALALWHGPLLANVPSEALHSAAVPRLTEERLRAVERVADIRLVQGLARQAVPDLWSATRAYPGHERFAEQLVEALYRTGRQAEALAETRRIREYLRDELGLDPGPALRQLELAILRGDPPAVTVDGSAAAAGRPGTAPPGPVGGSPSGPVGVAPSGPLGVAPSGPLGVAPAGPIGAAPAGAVGVVPAGTAGAPVSTTVDWATPSGRVLADVPGFTGRATVARAILADLTTPAGGQTIVIVTGQPGVGKSALARHVGYRAQQDVPRDHLAIELSAPDGSPRSPGELAGELITCLDRPAGTGRLLVTFDDVVDVDQARWLLSYCGPAATVLITSSMQLTGLVAGAGARAYRLGPLTAAESRDLLVTLLGPQRTGAEPRAVDALAAACGHLPLALRILGARLLTRPGLRITDAVEWLAGDGDRVRRMALAGDPQMSMANRLERHLSRLEPDLVRAFARLAALSGPVTPPGAARVLGVDPATAERLLDHLVDANLLDPDRHGCTMPDLLRAFAAALPPAQYQSTLPPA